MSVYRRKEDDGFIVKSIPRALLSRYEWGHDDYSHKVENLPQKPPEPGQMALFTEEEQ